MRFALLRAPLMAIDGAMLNTATFPEYLRSLHLTGPVTTHAGVMVAGPPPRVAELGLRLGLGPAFLNTPQTRSILANLDLDPALMGVVAPRLRSLALWRTVWEDAAAPYLKAADKTQAEGDSAGAARAIRTALTLLNLAYGGDGHYFHTPMVERRRILPVQQRLHARLRAVTGDRVERLVVPHARGVTHGLLHLPSGAAGRVPAVLGIHQLSGNKDDFDVTLAPFRAAGLATFCVDLPAHGENFEGPRLQPDDEQAAWAALQVLAGRPEVDPERLAVLGGSLGAFLALRTAARAGGADGGAVRLRACVAYASPFDIGYGIRFAVRGIRENFAWMVGARTPRELLERAEPFHLRQGLDQITCPVLVVHGTQDHICDFTASYEVARRVRAPLAVHPLVGADHEVAMPYAPHLAAPGIAWLQQHLAAAPPA